MSGVAVLAAACVVGAVTGVGIVYLGLMYGGDSLVQF